MAQRSTREPVEVPTPYDPTTLQTLPTPLPPALLPVAVPPSAVHLPPSTQYPPTNQRERRNQGLKIIQEGRQTALTPAEQLQLLRIVVHNQWRYKPNCFDEAYAWYQEELNRLIRVPYYGVKQFLRKAMNVRVGRLRSKDTPGGAGEGVPEEGEEDPEYLALLDAFIERVKKANRAQRAKWKGLDEPSDEERRGSRRRSGWKKRRVEEMEDNCQSAEGEDEEEEGENEDDQLPATATEDPQPATITLDSTTSPQAQPPPSDPTPPTLPAASPARRTPSPAPVPKRRKKGEKKNKPKSKADPLVTAFVTAATASTNALAQAMAAAVMPVREPIENRVPPPQEDVMRLLGSTVCEMRALGQKVDEQAAVQRQINWVCQEKFDRILALLEGRYYRQGWA